MLLLMITLVPKNINSHNHIKQNNNKLLFMILTLLIIK